MLFMSIVLSMMASIVWAQKGSVYTITTTMSPASGSNGFVSEVTLKYQFMICAGDIKLAAARQNIRETAYIFGGKNYSANEVGGFPSKIKL